MFAPLSGGSGKVSEISVDLEKVRKFDQGKVGEFDLRLEIYYSRRGNFPKVRKFDQGKVGEFDLDTVREFNLRLEIYSRRGYFPKNDKFFKHIVKICYFFCGSRRKKLGWFQRLAVSAIRHTVDINSDHVARRRQALPEVAVCSMKSGAGIVSVRTQQYNLYIFSAG